jgi:hypothetical protein
MLKALMIHEDNETFLYMLHASDTCNALYLDEATTCSFTYMTYKYHMGEKDWFYGHKEISCKYRRFGECLCLIFSNSLISLKFLSIYTR